jgi:hypothetical protein
MMKFGERQVAPTAAGIRRDHVARYQWAAKMLPVNSRVIDFACGVGYGSRILADAGHKVRGYDKDNEALSYAERHYHGIGTLFLTEDGTDPHPMPSVDAAVCFETIEHLKDPRPLLKALRESAPLLLVSVPNETAFPWSPAPGVTTAYHFRHYTLNQFKALLEECGWCVTGWAGQLGPESEVGAADRSASRTLIATCQREAVAAADDDLIQSAPPGVVSDRGATEPDTPDGATAPPLKGKHVAILGLGPSLDQYLEITKRLGGRSKFCDETWAINALGDVFACELVFHMDDIRIQEIRAAAAPASNIAAMVNWIKTSPVPVVTSRNHPDYPALVEFPLEDVLNNLGHDYFNSTAAYAIAFAIHTGVAKISLFGMDFSYPNQHDAEKGRACVEYWLGQAQARGILITLPKTTTLMDACYPKTSRLYGYDTLDLDFDVQPDGSLKLGMTPRTELPTAEEIEANYDHSAPIDQQHQTTKE